VSLHGSRALPISKRPESRVPAFISDDGVLAARLLGSSSASDDEEIPHGPVAAMAASRDRGLGRGDDACHRICVRAGRASAHRSSRLNSGASANAILA